MRHDKAAVTVRFEHFLDDPPYALQRIFVWLGVPDESGPARFATENLIHPLDHQTTLSNPKSVSRSRKPAWNHFSRREKIAFPSICGEAMRLLDYEVPSDAEQIYA
jgi:hypothetical protein